MLGAAEGALAENARTYRWLVRDARLTSLVGGRESAASAIQVAGSFAWYNHPGVHVEPGLERALRRLSAAVDEPGRGGFGGFGSGGGSSAGPRRPRHVGHIATGVYRLGGHSRLLERWIRSDQRSRHTLIITNPDRGVPERVEAAVLESGGAVHQTTTIGDGFMESARRVREALRDADLIAVHGNPNEVVASLALAAWEGAAPAVHVNHVDHAFWLGAGAVRAVANLRPAAVELNVSRRLIKPDRNLSLPIPLEPLPSAAETRAAARQELGIDDSEVVLVAMASAFKFETEGSPHFSELWERLGSRPEVRIIVIGVQPEGLWARAAERSGGRLQCVGPQPEPDLFLDAADVYVDSFPLGSVTSVMEAALRGLPTVAWSPQQGSLPILTSADLGIESAHRPMPDFESFLEALRELVDDPSVRIRAGEQNRAAVLDQCCGAGWSAALERLYEDVVRLPRSPALRRFGRRPAPGPIDLALVRLSALLGFPGRPASIRLTLPMMPPPRRQREIWFDPYIIKPWQFPWNDDDRRVRQLSLDRREVNRKRFGWPVEGDPYPE